jgi:uncharacterized ferritin-like protein (DUF455 family)
MLFRFPDLSEIVTTIREKIIPGILTVAGPLLEASQGLGVWNSDKDSVTPLPKLNSILPPPQPARPSFFNVWQANDVPEKDPIEGLEKAAKITHMSLVCLETVSLELTASYFAQFPEIDWATQMLLSRHNFDEARHCRILWELLRSLGKNIFSYKDIDIRTWVVNQRYTDLAEKIAVSHRLLESYGVEACVLVAMKLRKLGLVEGAMIYDVQQVDEIAHVRSADAILRYLKGNDYDEFMERTFDQFVQEVPKIGLAVDRILRLADGFSPDEIERFQGWR